MVWIKIPFQSVKMIFAKTNRFEELRLHLDCKSAPRSEKTWVFCIGTRFFITDRASHIVSLSLSQHTFEIFVIWSLGRRQAVDLCVMFICVKHQCGLDSTIIIECVYIAPWCCHLADQWIYGGRLHGDRTRGRWSRGTRTRVDDLFEFNWMVAEYVEWLMGVPLCLFVLCGLD